MDGGDPRAESHTLAGPIDRAALLTIRDVVTTAEPLATASLDDFVNPSGLAVTLDDGLCDADAARLDIEWTTRNDFKFHYTDSDGVDLRWDKHDHDGDYANAAGPEHYHPPPDATSDPHVVEAACITQTPAELVTRAVLTLWRAAYHADDLSRLNAGHNPP